MIKKDIVIVDHISMISQTKVDPSKQQNSNKVNNNWHLLWKENDRNWIQK